MKKLCFVLIVLIYSITCYSQKEIKIEDAKNNVGEMVKVCTKILDTDYQEAAKGSPTYLYAKDSFPNNALAFIIWGEKRKFFDYKPEKDLRERDVCVTGKIEILKEKPVMIIDKQSQVQIK